MTVAIPPWVVKPQFCDANGNPLDSGTVWIYLAGTSTLAPVYADADGSIPFDNPFTLNAAGESVAPFYLLIGQVYDWVLKDELGATRWTVENWSLPTSLNVTFATRAEAEAGVLTTKVISPDTGAYAYDRLRKPGLHEAGKATKIVLLTITGGAVTPNANSSNVFKVTATEAITINNPTNPKSGQHIAILVAQDATGSRAITLGSKYKGGTLTFSTAANACDILSCVYDDGVDQWACALRTNAFA